MHMYAWCDCSSLAELIKENSVFLKSENQNKFNNDPNYDVGDMFDSSVFGNTYESFFEFANRRTFEIESRNKDLYEKSMKACIYAAPFDSLDENKEGRQNDADETHQAVVIETTYDL